MSGRRSSAPFVERERRDGDIRHGTPTGARAHSVRGESPCDACRAAKAEYDRRNRSAPDLVRRNRLHAKAQRVALKTLKDAHPDEYRRYYLIAKENILREVEVS